MILANENDIYIFFEIIEQLEPKSILDLGMFLKRVGSVSRNIMNREMPCDIRLDGVDFFPEINFPVWNNIYDEIIDYKTYFGNNQNRKYDCTILLGTEELKKAVPFSEIIKAVEENTRYMLVSCDSEIMIQKKHKIVDLKVENDTYYLMDFGE